MIRGSLEGGIVGTRREQGRLPFEEAQVALLRVCATVDVGFDGAKAEGWNERRW